MGRIITKVIIILIIVFITIVEAPGSSIAGSRTMTKTEFDQAEKYVINRLKEHHNKWGTLLGESYRAIWKYEIKHDPAISEREYQQALLDAYESIFMLGFLNSAFSTLIYESDPIERLYPGIGKNTQETFKTFVKEPMASQVLKNARILKFHK